jgi:hypothetical protein
VEGHDGKIENHTLQRLLWHREQFMTAMADNAHALAALEKAFIERAERARAVA